ncbi:hypothetical protein PO909_024865 [Leuciscus waleckii]
MVFLVRNADGDPYVVKQMNSRDKEELVEVQKEVEILKKMNCGYIVSYLDSFEDEAAGLFITVMEYCAGGDLSKKMQTQKEKGFFEEEQITDWFIQICLALQYLHKCTLHRDIKPRHVFLTEDGYINLGDFGCSKTLTTEDAYASSVVGAELYVCPEVYEKKYNSKCDIWSLGWLLHDLCMLDVWANILQCHLLYALSMTGTPPPISERYSEELRELIRQMLSCDPKDRPSADEILAKPFLKEAVDRNKRIPEALEQRLMKSINAFDEAYDKHYKDFEVLVSEWGNITGSMESAHYNATAGSLTGSVIGAAGGITAVVGAILAPFTFGASLIVTGVGIGVGVAGGLAGAASSITDTVKQKSFRESLEKIQQKYEIVSEPILNALNTVRMDVKKMTKFSDFVSNLLKFDKFQISCNVDKTKVAYAAQLLNLGLLANVSRIAAHSAKAGRVAAAAVSGVISGLLVIVDFVFIANDSREIHEMRQGKVDDPEKVSSSVLKSIAQMRKTHSELCNVLKGIKENSFTHSTVHQKQINYNARLPM